VAGNNSLLLLAFYYHIMNIIISKIDTFILSQCSIKGTKMTVSNYAATEIQRVVRGYLSRMRVNKLAEKEKELWLIKMKISATLKATCVRQKVKKDWI